MDSNSKKRLTNIFDYWRRTQISAALESLTDEREENDDGNDRDEKSIIRDSFSVDAFRAGEVSQHFAKQCFIRLDLEREKKIESARRRFEGSKWNKPVDLEPAPEFAEVVLSPFSLDLPGEEDFVHLVFAYAKIDRNGKLFVADDSADLPPIWIGRRSLKPTTRKGDLIPLADAHAFYRAAVAERRRVKNWPRDWNAILNIHDNIWRTCTNRSDTIEQYLGSAYILHPGWVRMETAMPVQLSIALQYERLIAAVNDNTVPQLLTNACLNETRAEFTDGNNSLYLGHMTDRYSLTRTQREAVVAFRRTPNSRILAVHGPPGTGKTTLLQSIVATEFVSSIVEKRVRPPLFLACAATNQAVSNVIKAFKEATTEIRDDFADRWIPGAGRRLGVYFRAMRSTVAREQAKASIVCIPADLRGTRIEDLAGYTKVKARVETLDRAGEELPIEEILRLCETAEARRAFLEKASSYFGTPVLTLQQAYTFLGDSVRTVAKRIEGYETRVESVIACRAQAGLDGEQSTDSLINTVYARVRTAKTNLANLQQQHREERNQAELTERALRNAEDEQLQRLRDKTDDDLHAFHAKHQNEIDRLRVRAHRLNEYAADYSLVEPPTSWWSYLLEKLPWIRARLKRDLRNFVHDLQLDGFGDCKATEIDEMRAFIEETLFTKTSTGEQLRAIEAKQKQVERAADDLINEQSAAFNALRASRQQKQRSLDDDRLSRERSLNAEVHFAEQLKFRVDDAIEAIDAEADKLQITLPDKIDELHGAIDTTLRVKAFLLAMHAWEARFLIALEKREVNWRAQKEREQAFRLLAMITPCFVATFDKVPSAFNIMLGDTVEPLWEFADVLIIDEAGQASPDKGAYAFAFAEKGLVVGDVLQLPPVDSPDGDVVGTILAEECSVANDHFTDRGMLVGLTAKQENKGSLMWMASAASSFDQNKATRGMMLREHYRCDDRIIAFCNEVWYTGHRSLEPRGGIRAGKPFHLVNTIGSNSNRSNREEVDAIVEWIAECGPLIEDHYNKNSSGEWIPIWKLLAVLTPFRNQAYLLRKHRDELYSAGLTDPQKITMGTVHALQGAERNIVLFSTVYDRWMDSFFFDREHTLLNVAVSRAKDSFIVFGNESLFPTSRRDPRKPSSVLAHYLAESMAHSG